MDKSIWDALLYAKGETVKNYFYNDNIRILVKRGGFSWCAYIGIPLDNPLANKDYEGIDIDCHGGLTYSGTGIGDPAKGWFWYGWDYAHCFDAPVYEYENDLLIPNPTDHKWTAEEVEKEAVIVAQLFQELMQKEEDTHG